MSVSIITDEVESRGFAIVRRFASGSTVARLLDDLAGLPHGARGLLERGDAVAAFAASDSVLQTMRGLVGPRALAVRAFALEKHADSNWALPWHQDVTIAVRARHEVPGFGPWSEKDGVTHVRPPRAVLENMASLRLHLDDAPGDSGPLLVAAGTQKRGVIPASEIANVAADAEVVSCECLAGDALFARPLLLHASRRSQSRQPRRILHIEFAGCRLPAPLEWRPF